jgi:hypothetical protein
MINKYNKLQLPKDSAWRRKTWRSYTPIWFNRFIDGVHNIIRWIPTIYKDKDWDDYYITKILQKKIEHQRKYIVEANRHTQVDQDNYWMTVVLNLIEREHEEYYGCEYMDYIKRDMIFTPIEGTNSSSLDFDTKWENLDEYINKYPGVKYRVIKENKGVDFTEKDRLAMYMAHYRQWKCRNLIFEILKRKSNQWWD